MPERVPPRLRPHGQTVRHAADGDRLDRAVGRVEGVDDAVVAAGQPEPFAVRADVAHVGTAAAGYRPVRDDLARREIHYRHAAVALVDAGEVVRAAIGDVEALAVAARIEPVRADARLDEAGLLERVAVDDDQAVLKHVGDVIARPAGS